MSTASRPPWLTVEGVLLIVLGLAALVLPIAAGLAAALVFGWVLVLSGLVGIVGAFAARSVMHPGWSLISGAIALIVGALLLWNPFAGAISLTLLLAVYLAGDGAVLIYLAIDQRRRLAGRWGWLLASGIADLVLAAGIVALAPFMAPLMLGVVVGIDLVFAGIALIGLASRRPGLDQAHPSGTQAAG
jgi:uncharacterized membrane protein HdeD (DUF308 family)